VSLNTELYQTPEPLLAKLENAVNALLITTPPKKKNHKCHFSDATDQSGSMKNILAGYITIL